MGPAGMGVGRSAYRDEAMGVYDMDTTSSSSSDSKQLPTVPPKDPRLTTQLKLPKDIMDTAIGPYLNLADAVNVKATTRRLHAMTLKSGAFISVDVVALADGPRINTALVTGGYTKVTLEFPRRARWEPSVWLARMEEIASAVSHSSVNVCLFVLDNSDMTTIRTDEYIASVMSTFLKSVESVAGFMPGVEVILEFPTQWRVGVPSSVIPVREVGEFRFPSFNRGLLSVVFGEIESWQDLRLVTVYMTKAEGP